MNEPARRANLVLRIFCTLHAQERLCECLIGLDTIRTSIVDSFRYSIPETYETTVSSDSNGAVMNASLVTFGVQTHEYLV